MNNRRHFFKQVANKSAEMVLKEARQRANAKAEHWIRPPYAVEEVEFLLACTRCDACQTACPHDIIFKLPARVGVSAMGTPALDLIRNACRLCEGWPCVSACEPDALVIFKPDDENRHDAEPEMPLPRLAQCWIDTERCLPYSGPECGACKGECPVAGALRWDDAERPAIDSTLCIGCAACRSACIMLPSAIGVRSLPAVVD